MCKAFAHLDSRIHVSLGVLSPVSFSLSLSLGVCLLKGLVSVISSAAK